MVKRAVLLKNLIPIDAILCFVHFFKGSKFSFHIKEWGEPVRFVLLFLKIS
jgi:hypothetical protein